MPLFYMKTFNNLSVLYNNESLIFFYFILMWTEKCDKNCTIIKIMAERYWKKTHIAIYIYIYIYLFIFLLFFFTFSAKYIYCDMKNKQTPDDLSRSV